MDKRYEPSKIEEKWYRRWLESGVFHSSAEQGGEAYCVVIPPPNVTGILHMGHALNNTIQDILVRWRRMQGRNVVWMPGTDHAGIATQNVVERALKEEGKTREDLGRDAFVARVWKWREEYGGTIIRQLKRLGASCDWQRERFTMDEGLSEAVAEVFVRLYEKGLIYRANYIINWCPRCRTALSDEESDHVPTRGRLYYIRYRVREEPRGAKKTAEAPPHVVVATTRPETLLGDTAVAVHPADKRYRNLRGRTVVLPVLGRELQVIEDEVVDPDFGTGVVKVTPAHDPNDFQMGLRHGLTPVNVMNEDGTMNEEAGPYQGMDRDACRKRIVKDLEAEGLIEKIEDHDHAVGHCYRCDTVVEPRLSPQWFVKMKPLAAPAIEAVRSGKVEFLPPRWTKVYLEWMENIRDWCISRQIWWGHRIPIFTCEACGHEWAAKGRPETCAACGKGPVRQEEDVLDTWFSSWLWPFSTFGWPGGKEDLSFYYPTHDLVTASEIIFFWVARMIMAGCEFMGEIPFRRVYIHGTVRDSRGQKMSKSLGNALDPLTIIDRYSADALRFSLMMIAATGQDVYVSVEKFEIGRNFGTKLWNAARFLQMQGDGAGDRAAMVREPTFEPGLLRPDDHHILGSLKAAIESCTESLERCRFNDAALALYDFVWHQYCDWYLEYAKDALYGDDADRKREVLRVAHTVLSAALRLLHPMMPFLTEELWHSMGYGGEDDLIVTAPWPEPFSDAQLASWGVKTESVAYVEGKHDLIRAGRTLRSDYGIVPSRRVDFFVKPNSEEDQARLTADLASLTSLLGAGSVTVDTGFEPDRVMPSGVSRLATAYMPLEGVIDLDEERARLSAQLAKVTRDLERATAKLENTGFVDKAPAEVVEAQKARKRELAASSEKLNRLLATLNKME